MERPMTDEEIVNAWDDICKVLNKDQDQLKHDILNHVGNKWSLFVIHALGIDGKMRFSNLENHIRGISQRMLAKCLRELERDGLVLRTVHPEVPPKVEYELTTLGRGLLVQVTPLWLWIALNSNELNEARENYLK
ncbi:winged helix-turn-helix transcriptional regulator [Chryseobacterium sp. S-02]|jgi:DNA-binding HxlR family transcriptional regulator|uniref:winged helix-turn-helix transcriptional regulator n=1 Tax=unclassified Chryseobacterium TaxID=2593645 RepID=UPI0028567105|nr:helix-turn-helix domain-containing protein [Chryseobacterium sp. 2987]MDF2931121.1 HxlR family transcriptional regulator [Chryseobacterium sp.]MDR6919929.1 DNA-binding HxlR family transcriptional regulator [Chryseobacterium sp. 2987]